MLAGDRFPSVVTHASWDTMVGHGVCTPLAAATHCAQSETKRSCAQESKCIRCNTERTPCFILPRPSLADGLPRRRLGRGDRCRRGRAALGRRVDQPRVRRVRPRTAWPRATLSFHTAIDYRWLPLAVIPWDLHGNLAVIASVEMKVSPAAGAAAHEEDRPREVGRVGVIEPAACVGSLP